MKWDVKLFNLPVQGECNTRNKCRHYCVCWCPDNLCYRYISRPDISPAIMFFMRLLWTRIYSVVAYDHTFVAISRVGYICMSLYVLNGLEMIISRPTERREVVLSISPNHCDNLPHYPHVYLSHKPIIIPPETKFKGGILDSPCSSVRLSVCLSVRPSVRGSVSGW